MRKDDWPSRLSAEIDKARLRTFRYGKHDCFGFAVRCERAMCGETRFADISGAYTSQKGAERVLVKNGWRSVEDIAAERLTEIKPVQAQRGDWCSVLDANGVPALAVCMGPFLMTAAPEGITHRPMSEARRAWKI